MNKIKNILVFLSRMEFLVSISGFGLGVPVCEFYTPFPLQNYLKITCLTLNKIAIKANVDHLVRLNICFK